MDGTYSTGTAPESITGRYRERKVAEEARIELSTGTGPD